MKKKRIYPNHFPGLVGIPGKMLPIIPCGVYWVAL